MIRLAVRVARAEAELVLAELLELAPGGLEERDLDAGTVEYSIYGAPGELPALPELHAAVGEALVEVCTTEVPDDWAERWKVWHRPVDVAWRFRRLRVRPPWEPPLGGEAIDLVIDPGQAFGTGAHHTTRLCLQLLLELEPAGALADWGSGSGVLAIAAARLGHAPVLAVDIEPASLEASRENAVANGVPEVEVRRHNLRREPAPWAPTVTANLVRPLLLDVARLLERAPELLIVSGLLREEADEVAEAFAGHGLRERDRRFGGEWAALLLAYKSHPPGERARRPAAPLARRLTAETRLHEILRVQGLSADTTARAESPLLRGPVSGGTRAAARPQGRIAASAA